MSRLNLVLRHDRGELGPKTIDEWAAPNGDESLLVWMLREIERQGGTRVELVTVDEEPFGDSVESGLYFEEIRP